MNQKTRILIAGCIYGAGNIGDEAILEGLLEYLPKEAVYSVCVQGDGQKFAALGLQPYGTQFWQLVSAVRNCDTVLLGGASLLTDPSGLEYPIGYCSRILRIAAIFGKPCHFIGIGAATLNSDSVRQVARRFYPYAERFYVRNAHSKAALCREIGVSPERVTEICDPAFLLGSKVNPAEGVDILKSIGVQKMAGRPLIGVSVVNEGFEKGRDYKAKIAAICDLLVERLNAEIIFLYSEIREGEFFDQAASRDVKALMKKPWKEVPPHFFNATTFASILAGMDCILTMRMHVIILSAVTGTPTATIVREEKVTQILADLDDQAAGSITSIDVESVFQHIRAKLANREVHSKHLLNRVAMVSERAVANRPSLGDLLENKQGKGVVFRCLDPFKWFIEKVLAKIIRVLNKKG